MDFELSTNGFVTCAKGSWRAALGRSGIGTKTREGDGITPVGRWAMGRVFWRADRLSKLKTDLETVALAPNWGWCDDPTHVDYNRLITLPHPAHHEKLWREDALYNVIVELAFNANPIIANLGSAVFLHVAKPDYSSTQGCVGLALADLLDLLSMCQKNSTLVIHA